MEEQTDSCDGRYGYRVKQVSTLALSASLAAPVVNENLLYVCSSRMLLLLSVVIEHPTERLIYSRVLLPVF